MSSLYSFEVNFPHASFPVHCGAEILSQGALWPEPEGQNRRAMVFLDSALQDSREALLNGLEAAGWQVQIDVLEGSEQFKDFKQLYPLYARLLEEGIQRRSLIVAVGGGTIGDAIGFLAATYLRGVNWVNVPSTLLAQVDSCLGGKTAVNHEAGKNLIGAFHQPSAILCDVSFLKGISDRDRVSGLGEMLKYGFISDPEFGQWLLQHQIELLRYSPEVLAQGVQRSLKIKASFVEQDERDLTGLRAILNFGHTFGHAFETAAGYGYYRHGEAVILGMHAAISVSQALGLISDEEAESHLKALSQLPLPELPEFKVAELIEIMRHDKKNDGATINCLLFEKPAHIKASALSSDRLAPLLQAWLEKFN